MRKHISEIFEEQDNLRLRFRQIVIKHYGVGNVNAIIRMLQVGCEDFVPEIMSEWKATVRRMADLIDESYTARGAGRKSCDT